MNLQKTCLAVLVLGVSLACNRKPVFAWDISPDFQFERVATLAKDPREMVWNIKGMQIVDGWEFRDGVSRNLEAKGYKLVVDPQAADLWLEVIVLAPGSAAGNESQPGGPMGGRSRGGRPGGDMTAGAADGRIQTMKTHIRGRSEVTPEDPAKGDVTVFVKLLSRTDQKTVWYGTLDLPARKPGKAQATILELMAQLLQPLPAHGVPAGR